MGDDGSHAQFVLLVIQKVLQMISRATCESPEEGKAMLDKMNVERSISPRLNRTIVDLAIVSVNNMDDQGLDAAPMSNSKQFRAAGACVRLLIASIGC